MLRYKTNSHLAILLIIVFIGMTCRLALALYVGPYHERYIQADAIGYNQIAINILSGHGFSMETNYPFTPDNFRTPVYPLTISLIYYLFGYRPDLILLLQAFMGAFTILLTYLLATSIGGLRTGLLAAAFLAVSPHSITYTALLWSDTEFTMLFILSILLIVLIFHEIKYQWIFWGGLVLGISTLIHPRSLYLPILFALLLIGVLLKRKISIKQSIAYVCVFLIVFNLVLLPWRYRNYIAFGIPNVTSASGINMLHYGAALTEASLTGEDQWSIANRYDTEVIKISSSPLNPAEFGESALRYGINKILQHPFTYIKVHMIGMLKIFLPGTSQINAILVGQQSQEPASIYSQFTTGLDLKTLIRSLTDISIISWFYIGFEILYICWIYFFTIHALFKRNSLSPWSWFIALVLVYLAAVVGPAGTPRFRVVMMPLLSVLAANGILSIHSISRKIYMICKS